MRAATRRRQGAVFLQGRRPLVPLTFIVGGLAVGLLLAEVGVRLAAPFLNPIWRVIIREEAHQGARSAMRVDRDVRIILKRSDFQRRQDAVVVGDSLVFGTLVGQQETFAAVLARQTGKSVLNLGIGSAGPCVYNHMLGLAIKRLREPPRTIVYTLFANDIADSCAPASERELFVWDNERTWTSRLRRGCGGSQHHSDFFPGSQPKNCFWRLPPTGRTIWTCALPAPAKACHARSPRLARRWRWRHDPSRASYWC